VGYGGSELEYMTGLVQTMREDLRDIDARIREIENNKE
jgi:hypothetical protein